MRALRAGARAACVAAVVEGNWKETSRHIACSLRIVIAGSSSSGAGLRPREEKAMEVKVLLCNCKGLCASFKDADMNTLPFAIESDLDVKYTVLHPQLCGQGGNAVLEDVFRSATPDTYVLVGACAPDTQAKLFKRIMRTTGFDEHHMISVDIRGVDNDGIEKRIKEAVEGLLKRPDAGAPAAA